MTYRNGRAVANYKHPLLLMLDEFPVLGRLEVFAEALSLIAGYGLRACLIAQDLSQIHAAYGHDESITSNCNTRVAFTPNRIETARWISAMAGEATVRHSHRTVSNSGASISEPEIQQSEPRSSFTSSNRCSWNGRLFRHPVRAIGSFDLALIRSGQRRHRYRSPRHPKKLPKRRVHRRLGKGHESQDAEQRKHRSKACCF